METLSANPRFFAQIQSDRCMTPREEGVRGHLDENVIRTASSLLGSGFPFKTSAMANDSDITGLVIYDSLTRLLPVRSPQSTSFWIKVAKPFASMLETAAFPISAQITFLTFVYARLIGMMGPSEAYGPASLMTYDGSPVELSWVMNKNGASSANGGANRQLRFAIEPIDPRSGRRLSGTAVLKYLMSPVGSLGLIKSEEGALDWSNEIEKFLFPEGDDDELATRFFIGFDFSPEGDILLKTYYLPSSSPSMSPLTVEEHGGPAVRLWDVDYNPLRGLISAFSDPALIEPLETMIGFVEDVEDRFRPRLEIVSVDCIQNKANRLKVYGRPAMGSSWTDVWRGFTLNGRLPLKAMKPALNRLETLWNLLFPLAHSRSNLDLDEISRSDDAHRQSRSRQNPQHPTGGLLFYYSLVPGSRMLLPKIYLPVSRYCKNDLVIAQAMERFYVIDKVKGVDDGVKPPPCGWVSREISAAYNHRALSEGSGIHTYITFALKKDFSWEVTSYFSPEVWEHTTRCFR